MPNFEKSRGYKMKGNPFKRNFGIGESPMKGYKSDAQRKAVHASKAEKSAMSMKHEGPMKAYHTAMKKHDGKTFDDAGFMDSHFPSGAPRSAAKMYGKKSPAKMAHDKAPAKMKHGKSAMKNKHYGKSAMKKTPPKGTKFSDKPIYNPKDEALIQKTAKIYTNIKPSHRRKMAIEDLKKSKEIGPKRRYSIK